MEPFINLRWFLFLDIGFMKGKPNVIYWFYEKKQQLLDHVCEWFLRKPCFMKTQSIGAIEDFSTHVCFSEMGSP